MKLSRSLVVLGALLPLGLPAQETPAIDYNSLNQGVSLAFEPGTPEEPNPLPLVLSFWQHTGRVYYVEGTDDLVTSPWQCLPVSFTTHYAAEFIRTLSVSFTTPRYFLRVRYVEGRRSGRDGATYDRMDADHDGVTDYEELYFAGTHPLVSRDVDADGLPDDWERRIFSIDPPAANLDFDPLNDVGPLHASPDDLAEPASPALGSVFARYRRDWVRGACASYGTQFFWFEVYQPATRTVILAGDQGGSMLVAYPDDDLGRPDRIEVHPRTEWQTLNSYPPEDARRQAAPKAVYTWTDDADPALAGYVFAAVAGRELLVDPVVGGYVPGPPDGTIGRDLLRFHDQTPTLAGGSRPFGATVQRVFRRAEIATGSGSETRRIPAALAITSTPAVLVGRDRFPVVLRDFSHLLPWSSYLDFDGSCHPLPGAAQPGWVLPELDADGLPAAVDQPARYVSAGPGDYNPLMFRSPHTFSKWYRDDSAQPYLLPGIRSSHPSGFTPPGEPYTYHYGVYTNGLYPHANDVAPTELTLGKFSTELHARLDYDLNTRLYLASNDDCWVFINGHLINEVFDRGGVPIGQFAISVNLQNLIASMDSATREQLGLGYFTGSCRIDVFHADRLSSATTIYGDPQLRLLSTTPLRPIYTYQVVAEASGPGPLHYAFATDPVSGAPLAPAGMTINPSTGKVFWDLYASPAAAPGTYPVSIRVSDSAGNYDIQTFTLTVLD